MNLHRLPLPFLKFTVTAAALLACGWQASALTPNEWRHRQGLDVNATGLARIDLPAKTLDAARPALEDLRIVDGAGNEVPWLVEQLVPHPGSMPRPAEFRSAIRNGVTVISLRTGAAAPLTGITLETPAAEFIKAVRVEGSHDGMNWRELAAGEPIFRQRSGAEKTGVSFEGGSWEFLRVTIADDRSQPIPFTGALLHESGRPAPEEAVAVSIRSRDESPGVTRLALDLGAANLLVSSLHIETPEPLFTRSVTVAVQEVTDAGVREQPLVHAVAYRIDIGGKNESALDIPLGQTVPSRELVLLVRNEDSPPLAISAVRATRRLSRLIFFAKEPGHYTLLTGNNDCAAPRYDLSALGAYLNNATAVELKLSPLTDNPEYKSREALGALALGGVNIDVAGWKFRKAIQLSHPGVQQLELDPETLSRAARDLRDLRVVREGQQLPFLLDSPSISRDIAVNALPVAPDPKTPALSRWSLKLPQPGLPITRLACASPSPLFHRDVRLWEEIADDGGNKYPREIGRATWEQTPAHSRGELVITIDQPPVGGTLFLETDNGDNPAVELRDFHVYYPVTRVLFKAAADAAKPAWLYYGNPEAVAPRYDLGLVGRELLRAEKSVAIAAAEETVKPDARAAGKSDDRGTILFWVVLAVVVAGLLALISRLLPEAAEKG